MCSICDNHDQADGWKVELISLLANPNQVRPKRFRGVYTKLNIFNMTAYRKVVYLDADTIVVKNIEDLFQCRGFCANLKHSERSNSGVLVVEPSNSLFKDMMSKVNSLPSYTGGDQGFLNSYYGDFANARLFEPNLPAEARKSKPVPEMERLSTLYNADVGLYMLASKFINGTNSKIPAYLGPASVFFCITSALFSLALTFIIIPRQVTPWTGLLLMYEWTSMTFFVLFGSCLRLIYNWGRFATTPTGMNLNHVDISNYDSGKGHQRHLSDWDAVTCFYGTGIAFIAVIAPSMPCIFGVSALFARLRLMIGGGMILAIFMTYVSEQLALRVFVKRGIGLDHDLPRTICFLC